MKDNKEAKFVWLSSHKSDEGKIWEKLIFGDGNQSILFHETHT